MAHLITGQACGGVMRQFTYTHEGKTLTLDFRTYSEVVPYRPPGFRLSATARRMQPAAAKQEDLRGMMSWLKDERPPVTKLMNDINESALWIASPSGPTARK